MTTILAIDPGTEDSAFVMFDHERKAVLAHAKQPNDYVRRMIYEPVRYCGANATQLRYMAVEGVASYGKPVGAEVFTTVMWAGRFIEAWSREMLHREQPQIIYRRDVKLHLCGTQTGVNDAVIRQRLIDLFGPGKDKAIGKKACPGPLYGIKADCWQALALAVTYADKLAGAAP